MTVSKDERVVDGDKDRSGSLSGKEKNNLAGQGSQGNGTVKMAENRQISQQQVQQLWNEVICTLVTTVGADPSISGTKSWADQVEEELDIPKMKTSVWDNFDIVKVSNAEGISDHCSTKVVIGDFVTVLRRQFQYCNVWAQHPLFLEVVETGWRNKEPGYLMFQVVKRLKALKKDLKELNAKKFKDIVTEAQEDSLSLKEA
ncbi:hypothetical protein HAX54_001907 [Datura stramonium]|uniref:Uncharacterized protein n=1 Tax=Datura stramonium TaxID=4076 RepID=A0ABS8RST6_DATST|nr:hypothetical protein [Datura stramonium]